MLLQRFPKSFIYGVHLFLLLLLFAVSVYIRLPNYNQPLGRHHEWITAHTLITLKIWEHGGGPEHYHFSPLYNYDGEFNKNIGILGGVSNQKGDYYYVSYPPFAFILPYYFFKLTGSSINTASIQVFGYILHFFTALLFYILLLTITNKKFGKDFYLPAWIGYAFYLFSAGNLWFHSNVYFVDVLIQIFIFAQLILFFKIWKGDFGLHKWHWLIFFVINFLAIYTEWLGLFVAFVFGLLVVVRWIMNRNSKWIIAGSVLLLSAILSLGLTVCQYSSISGFENLYNVSVSKYELRSGYSGDNGSEYGFSISNSESYENLRKNNDKNYRFTLQALVVIGSISLLVGIYRKKWFTINQYFILGIFLSGIILHLLIFFNFNAVHDFSSLKTGTLFILLIVFSCDIIFEFAHKINKKIHFVVIVITGLFLFIKLVGNYNHYITENSPQNLNMYSYNVGNSIYTYANPDEMVFVDSWILPECMYYAERNYHSKNSIQEATNFMKELNIQKGFFVYTKNTDAPIEMYRITMNGDSLLINP